MLFPNLVFNNSLMPICEICGYKKTKHFHKIDKFLYLICPRCLTLFLSPKPTKKQISSYYAKDFIYSAGEANEIKIRERAKSILARLKKLNPEGKTLLDIGSGFGYFIQEARKLEFIPTGIEPAKELFSISLYRYNDIVFNLTWEEYFKKFNKKKFDFISLIHVIEHVNSPQEIVQNAIKLLNPVGILYLETPNLDSHLFRAEKYNYTFLTPPDHIWLFSKKSFRYLLKKIPNIQTESLSTYSYPEHFMGIIKRNLKSPASPAGRQNSKLKSIRELKNKKVLKIDWKLGFGYWKFIKYLLFDKLFAQILTPILNLGNYGSILELYIRKK